MARKGLTLTDVQGLPEEVGWPAGHRISLQFLNAVAPGGLLVGSVYLTAGKGYKGPNIQFLDMLGEILVALRRPFVIGGDFNLARGHLCDSGWLAAVGAVVVGPPESEPTCLSSDKGSCIDYFLVSTVLGPDVVKSFVDMQPTVIRTHRPVYMDLRAADRNRKVITLRRPRTLPVRPIIGPAPRPPCYEAEANVANALVNNTSTQESLDDAFNMWANKAETEILNGFDCGGDPAFEGRVRPPTFAWTLATPKCRPTPRGNGVANVWHWIADRLRQLRGLVALGKGDTEHGKGLRRRLSRFRWPFANANSDQYDLWLWWVSRRRRLWTMSVLQLQMLE